MSIEAMKRWLVALEHAARCVQNDYVPDCMGHDWDAEIEEIRQAIEQAQKQEHVIDCPRCGHCCPQPEQDRHTLQAKGEHPAPCARHCEANAFQIEIRSLKAKLEKAKKKKPVQVSPLQFVEMVMEKEHLIGNPIVWAQWPNEEK